MKVIRRYKRRPSQDITGAFCATCQAVRGVERVEPQAGNAMFLLTCGHTIALTPGLTYRLDVQADVIILYPTRAELPIRQGVPS